MMISFYRWCPLKRGGGTYLLVLFIALGYLGVAEAAAVVKPAKVVLLLHGMNSNLKTWNKLVDNSAGFDGRCANTRDAKFATAKITANTEGVYCMRFDFGALDRVSTAPKGLDKKTCSETGGCAGDYSTFESLGNEIASSISRIRTRLGNQVQIVLLGHSRAGLVLRAFLQGNHVFKKNVVGVITTGTPHAGTPLGRYYTYLDKKCSPESDHDGFFDTSDCADDWRFVNSLLVKDVGGLDLKAPTIGYLSEISTAIKTLNANANTLPAIQLTQITYDNTKFGCLGGDIIDSEKGCGYDIFGKIVRFKPSSDGLNAVLNGRVRDALKGDGIVPVYSQKMSLLKGLKSPVKTYAKSKRVHIVETEQILDLTTALTNMYKRLGWVI